MLIILEGVDCSGKTTLAMALSEMLDLDIVKGSSFEQSDCTKDELFTKFMELSKLDNVILDRFIYSNEVYASEYEDFAILNDTQRRAIEDEIRDKAIVVYLYADKTDLLDRFNARGDDYVTIDRFDSLLERYSESIVEIEGLLTIILNTSALTTEQMVDFVLKKIK